MGSYQPLFSITVNHAYFSDGLWKGLDFAPIAATRKVMEGANILVRQTGSGVGVFYEMERSAALRLYEKPLRFVFLVRSRDRTLGNYTALPSREEGSILCFENAGKGETLGLSKGEHVSEKDLKPVDKLVAEGLFPPEAMMIPPDFIVNIRVDPASGPREYVINFNARESFWRYHLLGNMNRNNPFIVDLDNRVEFEFCGERMLPGNRSAKTFRSKKAIPFRERSNFRFQLREQGAGAGKVLIKRLPVGSELRLGFDLIEGRREIVSDSYINF